MRKILPPEGLGRRLALQSAVFGIGSGTYLTGSVVFFTLYVGLSPVQVGIGFSVAGLIGLVGSLPLGHLADRIGGRPAWTIGALAGAVVFALYPYTRGFVMFLIVLAAEAAAETLANAGRMVYTAAALPREDRVRTMAFVRAYLNVGFTIGSGLGAAALALDSRQALLILVLANAIGLTVNAFFVWRMPEIKATAPAVTEKRPSPWGVLKDHPYTALAGVIAVLWLHGTIWGELLPLWAITETDAPKPVLGALFALNTVLAVGLQVRATRGADSLRGSTRLTRWAALATAVACPVIALSGMTHGWLTVAVLGAAVVLTTATELWLSAAQWYFNTEIPPPEQRGAYLGAGKSMGGVARMLGPASMTFLAIRTGGWGWWLIAGLFAVCAALIRPVIAWVERTPRNGAPARA
ncbi:MFS transporter [Actinoplanes sp. CA-054009]